MAKTLTKLELKIMNILWEQQKAFVKDILHKWPESERPAYNTISTTVRILEDKGYVHHEAYGRTYQYFPLIGKCDYQKKFIRNIVDNVFSGSVSSLISTLVTQEDLEEKELERIKKLLER
jgi:predicted transcriptional regulator